MALLGGKRNTFKILGQRPEGRRPFGMPKCRWKDTIKVDLKEVEW
jgi:hypothetical protein